MCPVLELADMLTGGDDETGLELSGLSVKDGMYSQKGREAMPEE